MLPNLSGLGSDPRLGSEQPTGVAAKKRKSESQEAPAPEEDDDNALASAEGRWWPVSDGAFAIAAEKVDVDWMDHLDAQSKELLQAKEALQGHLFNHSKTEVELKEELAEAKEKMEATKEDRKKFRDHIADGQPPNMFRVAADPSQHEYGNPGNSPFRNMWTHVQHVKQQHLPSPAGPVLSMDVWTARPNLAGYEPDVDYEGSNNQRKRWRGWVADSIGGNPSSLPAIKVPKEIYLIGTITDLVGCKRCITAIGIVPIDAHDEDAAHRGLQALMDACPFYGLSG